VSSSARPDDALLEALAESRRLGFLGARPLPDVVDHARGFVTALAPVTGRVVDLGSGGGVPGLVIAHDRPDLELVLLDRRTKRTDVLVRLVRRLGWSDRVEVVAGEAEELVESRGGTFDAAVARGFGPPELTLTIGVALVRPGGRIVISEPPAGGEPRWSLQQLADAGVGGVAGPPTMAVFERRS
jgi:16S rRNA (guanine527-N7)-methyltransferase